MHKFLCIYLFFITQISRDAISGKSSSSGSYSIGGSNPNVTETLSDKVSVEKIKELPEKSEKSEAKGKEEKKAPNGEQKEQLVPKMIVRYFIKTWCNLSITLF